MVQSTHLIPFPDPFWYQSRHILKLHELRPSWGYENAPSFISRLPRSLSKVAHYKAAELKNFRLFYGLPCFFGVLSDDPSLFFCIQSKPDRISAEDIQDARKKIIEFVLNLPLFYGKSYFTSTFIFFKFFSILWRKWKTLDYYGVRHVSTLKTSIVNYDVFFMETKALRPR